LRSSLDGAIAKGHPSVRPAVCHTAESRLKRFRISAYVSHHSLR